MACFLQAFPYSTRLYLGMEPPIGFDVVEEIQGPQVLLLPQCVVYGTISVSSFP